MNTRQKTVDKLTFFSILTNLFFSFAKILAGHFSRSQALLADGIHSTSDLITDLAILIGNRFWDKEADSDHPHGHQRLENLVTIFIGITLVGVAIFIAVEATQNMIAGGSQKAPGFLALIIAILSIIIKEYLFRYTVREAKQIGSDALIANAWHHRSDALSSIPAALAILLAQISPSLSMADSIGAILVAVLIAITGLKIAIPNLDKIMDKAAPPEIVEKVYEMLANTSFVLGTHKIRTRFIGPNSIAIEIHIEVDPQMTVKEADLKAQNLKEKILNAPLGITDVIVKVEPHMENICSKK